MARLAGTRRNPWLELEFDRAAAIPPGVRLPTYPKPKAARRGRHFTGRPATVQTWVKGLPGRRFDKARGLWLVSDPGPQADRVLADLGFEVDLARGAKAGVTALADLASPWIELDPHDEWVTRVHPRFSGLGDLVPAGAVWVQGLGAFEVHTPDLRLADPALGVPAEIVELGARLVAGVPRGEVGSDTNRRWPAILAGLPRAPRRAPVGVGPIPDLGRFELFGYQQSGAYAVVGGHSFLADAPGLGKTVQAIAAHAMVATARLLVVCPPVAVSGWEHHLVDSGFATGEQVVVLRPSRKVPELPARGAVVVPDSLLAARPAPCELAIGWAPDGLIVDESHRLKTWDSERSRAVRRVAQRVSGLRVPVTGTAMLANPVELAPQLAISGHLDTVFGGLAKFLGDFARQDQFGNWLPRARALPRLREVLDEQVWVRRMPADVYNRADGSGPTMPVVLPARVRYVDVDLAPYREALSRQYAVIDAWLDELGHEPRKEDVAGFAAAAIGFISPLRKAAGLTKVPAAAQIVTDWVTAEGAMDRPLLVWVHHQEVLEPLRAALAAAGADAAFIDGSTSAAARGQVEQDFQGGRYGALVLSLQAAGVALTLTRAADQLFVETDWTPAVLTQARDRTARLGQTRATTLTTLVAPGTLDEHMQRVQRAKAAHLDVVMGSGNDTSVVGTATEDLSTPRDLVASMVAARVVARRGRRAA